jgi:hypothetical protein
MKWRISLFLAIFFTAPALAQESMAGASSPTAPVCMAMETPDGHPTLFPNSTAGWSDRLSGNHDFVNFIGWMSNPIQNIDPRALTALYPIFANGWVSNTAPIPNADGQLYGVGITIASSDRFSMGLSQGGYAVMNLSRNPIQRDRLIALDPLGRFHDVELGGSHDGWLNLGGFFQYTVIEDVKEQFLATAGLRWMAPCGSHDEFQGHGPAEFSPYLTVGKEFGKVHVLATGGYQFPIGPGSDNTKLFYANLHIDRQTCGWLYPLVEFNASYHEKSTSFGLDTRLGLIDFGNFESQGNLVSVAVGANAVLIPERLEIGAVYTTVIASQHNFEANGLLVKVMLRY